MVQGVAVQAETGCFLRRKNLAFRKVKAERRELHRGTFWRSAEGFL